MSYSEEFSDGFQVLHYSPGQFYNSHTDFFDVEADSEQPKHDVSSGGANRVATLFLYLSTVEIGGETVFPDSLLDAEEDMSTRARGEELRRQLVENGTIREGGLEWNMFDTCRRKLNVRPVKGELILFYNIDTRGVNTRIPYLFAFPLPHLVGVLWLFCLLPLIFLSALSLSSLSLTLIWSSANKTHSGVG